MTTQATEKKNYKTTLNLPQTAFPMEAKLTANEPTRLARWKSTQLYQMLLAQNAKKPKWVLHDGPPFANGDIHIGHVINKTLKDVIIRFRSMQGLPDAVRAGLGLPWPADRAQNPAGPGAKAAADGHRCRSESSVSEYAAEICQNPERAISAPGHSRRVGKSVSDDAPGYEAATLEVFAKFVEAGLVYKQLKPVPWSIENQTALADAELEYQDVETRAFTSNFRWLTGGGESSVGVGRRRHGRCRPIWRLRCIRRWNMPGCKLNRRARPRRVASSRADLVEKVLASQSRRASLFPP